MGHQGWVLSERLDSTQTLSEGEDLESLEESFSLLDTTLDIEGDHATEAALALLLGNVMIWVRGKTWVDHSLNLRGGLESLGDGHAVRVCTSHTNVESLARAHTEP